jgi:ABC-type Fe3+/spermidine/putrescine transport system ATPase subunit
MTGLAIVFDNISKVLSEQFRIAPLDLSIRPCEFFCVLGPSGCGKSTLLGLVGGWLKPDTGRLLFGEQDVSALPAFERPVRTCFQKGGFLFPHLTVAQNVAYALCVKGTPREQALRHASLLLAQVGLAGFDKRRPADLSGGETQRVSVARALADPQPVLLLDEMTAGLDRPLRFSICDLVADLVRRARVTTVYVTHDVEEAFVMAQRLDSRIAIMNDGTVVQIGPAADVYRKPISRFVAALVGESNIMPVADLAMDRTRTQGGNTFRLPPGERQPTKYVSVRPESFRFEKPANCDFTTLHGRIEGVEFAGGLTRVKVRCAGETFITSVASHTVRQRIGDECALYVSTEDVCVLHE